MQCQSPLMGQLMVQQGQEVAIDLDGIERAAPCLQQASREGAASGTDLHQVIRWSRAHCLDDATDHRRIVQEMLSEAFATRRVSATWGFWHQRDRLLSSI